MLNKDQLYMDTIKRIKTLISQESDHIAVMATIVCELHHNIPYFDWTGFYRNNGREELIIGPYQGTLACLRIPFSQGVCGKAARTLKCQIVPDVNKIEDHIACSATTRSEIVLPVYATAGLLGVLDIDSNIENAFDSTDQKYLEEIVQIFK